jgi:hypothetical protein
MIHEIIINRSEVTSRKRKHKLEKESKQTTVEPLLLLFKLFNQSPTSITRNSQVNSKPINQKPKKHRKFIT